MGDASPSGSYIFATLLRIPRFVGSAFSSGKLAVMVSFSLSHGLLLFWGCSTAPKHNVPINVNPVRGGGGADKGRGFDA